MTIKIDAHQHFWKPERGDYDWMPQDDPVLARNYLPADLSPSLGKHGIAKTVLVQAAATVEETAYMLGIADASEAVAAVVGWVNFEAPGHRRHLERFARHPKIRDGGPICTSNHALRINRRWLRAPDLNLSAGRRPTSIGKYSTISVTQVSVPRNQITNYYQRLWLLTEVVRGLFLVSTRPPVRLRLKSQGATF